MRRRTHTLYPAPANVRRTIEAFGLAWTAGPRMTLVVPKGELVPMHRAAHERTILRPNDQGVAPSPDRSTRVGGAKCPSPRPCARTHRGSAVANPAITVVL